MDISSAESNNFYVSNDKSLLNVETVIAFLTERSYWAKGRSKEKIIRSIENSLCFGIYDKVDNQVGFARVVTDFSIFAWIMDVFVVEEFRGRGLSKQLMSEIMSHPSLTEIYRWGLITRDAHGLYQQFGFQNPSTPELYMELVNKK